MYIPKVAYHGTSLVEAAKIIRTGGLKVGPSCHENKIGVYCERESRKYSCMNYASHQMFFPGTGYLNRVIFELMVDRSVGRTIHEQWVQSPDSIIITGIYTHMVNVVDLYKNGFVGWYRIHHSVWDQVSKLSGLKHIDWSMLR